MCDKDKALARCRLCRYAWHVQTALYALSCGAVAVSHDLNPNPKVLFRNNISYSSSLLCLLPWRTQDVHANGKDGMTEDLQFVPQCPTEQMLHFISCWKLLDVAQGCLVSAVLHKRRDLCRQECQVAQCGSKHRRSGLWLSRSALKYGLHVLWVACGFHLLSLDDFSYTWKLHIYQDISAELADKIMQITVWYWLQCVLLG